MDRFKFKSGEELEYVLKILEEQNSQRFEYLILRDNGFTDVTGA